MKKKVVKFWARDKNVTIDWEKLKNLYAPEDYEFLRSGIDLKYRKERRRYYELQEAQEAAKLDAELDAILNKTLYGLSLKREMQRNKKEAARSREESPENARQAKIKSGNEFKKALNKAVEYMKREHPNFSENESWIANKLHEKAKEWKSLEEQQREELRNEENPINQLCEILRQKSRTQETILKEIYQLKKPPKKKTIPKKILFSSKLFPSVTEEELLPPKKL